ncbi:MAG: ribbon-helix-helix protein, CopG family [Solirubrobacteraceae bacterium]
MRRTQISLTDAQYLRLHEESARTGLSLAELIRRALDQRYESISEADRRRLLESAFGSWTDRQETGEEYLARVRSGTARRLRHAT